jgi:hypothetical protein
MKRTYEEAVEVLIDEFFAPFVKQVAPVEDWYCNSSTVFKREEVDTEEQKNHKFMWRLDEDDYNYFC